MASSKNPVAKNKLIDKKHLDMIRKNVIPQINTKIATLDIYPHYTENNKEYEFMNQLPMFDSYFSQYEQFRDTIPKVEEKYETILKEINDVFDYFSNKYKKHFDTYISVHIADISINKMEKALSIFPTYYNDENRKYINVYYIYY